MEWSVAFETRADVKFLPYFFEKFNEMPETIPRDEISFEAFWSKIAVHCFLNNKLKWSSHLFLLFWPQVDTIFIYSDVNWKPQRKIYILYLN